MAFPQTAHPPRPPPLPRRSFKAAVQTQGVAELQKRQSAATTGLLGAVEQTLVQATPRAAPKLGQAPAHRPPERCESPPVWVERWVHFRGAPSCDGFSDLMAMQINGNSPKRDSLSPFSNRPILNACHSSWVFILSCNKMWELAEALNYGPAKNDGKQTPILERLEMGKFNFPRKIVIIFSSCDEKSKAILQVSKVSKWSSGCLLVIFHNKKRPQSRPYIIPQTFCV